MEKKPYEPPHVSDVRSSNSLFVSTMLYGASKKLGLERAQHELRRQLHGLAQAGAENIINIDDVAWWGFPAAVTLARLALCGPVNLHVNAGSTVIGRGRSLAAAAFLAEPSAAVWVSVDDDVVVSADALAAMVEQALREPCVVVAPCLQRESKSVDIVGGGVLIDANRMQRVDAGSFCCVAMSRYVAEQAYHIAGPESEWDEAGETRRAIFRDLVHNRKWWTEDRAFFKRFALAGVELATYAVRRGFSTHAGQRLDLETLQPPAERSPLVV